MRGDAGILRHEALPDLQFRLEEAHRLGRLARPAMQQGYVVIDPRQIDLESGYGRLVFDQLPQHRKCLACLLERLGRVPRIG